MKINWKKLIAIIFITFFIGSFFAIIIPNSTLYNSLNKGINFPRIVFPIVWSILYLLMAISLYIILDDNNFNQGKAIRIYFIQLIVNSLWTLIFFGFKLYLLSAIWIILLIILVIIMILKFYKINKIAGIINIPYLIWLLIATYLNFSIVILN